MPSKVSVFADAYQYEAAIRAADVRAVPTVRGTFRAELTRINFQRLWIQRFTESGPTIKYSAIDRRRAPILFLTKPNQPAIHHEGIDVSQDDIVFYGSGVSIHHRTSAECRFGTMSLSPDDLAATARALTGRDIHPPADTYCIRPSPGDLARLRQLHWAAGRLAATAPEVFSHPEASRALEEALSRTMIMCMAAGARLEMRRGGRQHLLVMARLEELLATHQDRPLYLSEICAATHVSERTIRALCQEHLGMGPVRYLWLRRMHLARRALLLASAEQATVTSIAMAHGFWELGRFSVAYKALFGEAPLASLRRSADDFPASQNLNPLPVFA
jgi:AraC-like DNA-binding protein